jgi:hypothetical protein
MAIKLATYPKNRAVKRPLIMSPLLQTQLDGFTIATASLLPNRGLFHTICAAS